LALAVCDLFLPFPLDCRGNGGNIVVDDIAVSEARLGEIDEGHFAG